MQERFEKYFIPEPNSGCWLWIGGSTRSGYGVFYVGTSRRDRKTTTAHRVSYQLNVGEIPDGFDIDHLCRVRCCVNPDHLEAVSRDENLIRSPNTFSSIHSKKTHCPSGHPYDETNVYIHQLTGHRQCRACRAIHSSNRKRKRNMK